MAVLLAALMIYGLTPGPVLFEENADFVWTVIASMFIGNVILLILNLPLVGLWAKLTDVPFGAFSTNHSNDQYHGTLSAKIVYLIV